MICSFSYWTKYMQIKTPINQFEQKIFLCKLFNKSNYNTRKWHKTLKDIYKTLKSNTKQSPLGEISSYSHSTISQSKSMKSNPIMPYNNIYYEIYIIVSLLINICQPMFDTQHL
jgi:hypothetical protein